MLGGGGGQVNSKEEGGQAELLPCIHCWSEGGRAGLGKDEEGREEGQQE